MSELGFIVHDTCSEQRGIKYEYAHSVVWSLAIGHWRPHYRYV